MEFRQFDLRARHVIALTLLRDFGERSQSDLAAALGIEPTNLVILLDDLESSGLVERRRSTADRRRHIVVLTDAGAGKLADIESVVAEIENRMFSTLTADERSNLHTLLQRAAAAASGGPETPAGQDRATATVPRPAGSLPDMRETQ